MENFRSLIIMGMDLITKFMYNHQNFKYFRLDFCLQRVLLTFRFCDDDQRTRAIDDVTRSMEQCIYMVSTCCWVDLTKLADKADKLFLIL